MSSNFLELSTLTINLDDVSSVPHCPTVGPDGLPSLAVSMTGAHSSLTLTDPDDMAAILTAVGQTEDKNEFLKKRAEETKKKHDDEAQAAKDDKAAKKHDHKKSE